MSQTAVVLTLLGFGLGLGLLMRTSGRGSRNSSLREQAIAAQRASAEASRVARELAARALEEES